LQEFLARILTESGAEDVHVIAHSMGNRALIRAARELERAGLPSFGHIILAAPDVDRGVFLNLASAYPNVSRRTTLYVSGKDKALGFSGWLAGFTRAGYFPPVTVLSGIDTVRVQDVDLTILGHSYYAEAREVLLDMQVLLTEDKDPANRPPLEAQPSASAPEYWSF